MSHRRFSVEMFLRAAGIISPYLAVILGVFIFKSGLFAVLLYHFILAVCIIGINRSQTLKLIKSGFHRYIGPLICLGGLLPGMAILFLWPYAKQQTADLAQLMNSVNLTSTSFTVFALYACLINPFLEESFWRGCFKPASWRPGPVDALFAGYHAVVLIPVFTPVFVGLSFLALMFVGWAFRNIYRLTDGLAIPLLTHIIADIAIFFAVWKIMQ